METGETFYIPSTQPVYKQPVNIPLPLTQHMDFYFNIVTVINFLTSVINAIVLAICYRKHKDFLSGIVTVTMETMQGTKETYALQLNDDIFTTESPVTYENSGTIDTHVYSIPWIFLIVLLTMLVIFALYRIFVLIIRPLMRK